MIFPTSKLSSTPVLPRLPLLLVMTTMLLSVAGPAAAEEPSYEFHIPQQAAATALQSVARATNTEVIFSPAQIEGIRTQSLLGRFTLSEAMERLLRGTDLTFNISAKGTIIITRAGVGR